jgi:sporulation protein YlmC with PRC-barrel domain
MTRSIEAPSTTDSRSVLTLTEILGQPVIRRDGARVGRLADVAVSLALPSPRVTRLLLRTGRGHRATVSWGDVERFGRDGSLLAADATVAEGIHVGQDDLWVNRDVVDTQIVDIDGRRVVRAADAQLELAAGVLLLVGVDVSVAAVLRRLGLERIGRRASHDVIAWGDLHPASPRGHALQLRCRADAVRRLDRAELSHVVASLTPEDGAEILELVEPTVAAGVLGAAQTQILRRRRFPHRKRRLERS